jgi:preprotein translocase subunit YajC
MALRIAFGRGSGERAVLTPLAWLPLAQAQPGAGGSPWQTLLLMGAVFVGLYALLLYPQRKQQREHEKMLRQIQRGDQVVTSGGIHGKVTGVAEDVLTIEIAERVRIKVSRSAIGARVASSAGEREKNERERTEREKEKKP